jgi:hypothetical protein
MLRENHMYEALQGIGVFAFVALAILYVVYKFKKDQ